MNHTIFLGNTIALIGAVIMVAVGFIKTKRNILLAQSAQFAIMGIGNLILGGVTGFLANMVSIVRNIVCLRTQLTVPLKLLFIGIQLLLGLPFLHNGVIGLLPILAACIFTWFLDTKSEVLLKSIIILMQIMWCVYDFTIHNYVSLAMDLFTILSNAAGIRMIKKEGFK